MIRKFVLSILLLPFIFALILQNNTNIENRTKNYVDIKLFFTNLPIFVKNFSDNFIFREKIISSYIYLNHLVNNNVHPNLFIGRDGYLFLKNQDDITNKQRNIIFPKNDELLFIKNQLSIIYNFFESRNIKIYFIPIPDQQTIHFDKLPGWHTKLNDFDKFSSIQSIFDDINRSEFYINIKDSLIYANHDEHMTYYKYESHWTEYGAMIASDSIIKHLSIHNNNQINLGGLVEFTRPDLLLKEKVKEVKIRNLDFEKIEILRDSNERYYKYTDKNNSMISDNNLLIYGDSFTLEHTYFPFFFINNFKSVSRISSNHQSLNLDIIDQFQPNIIFICVTERNFFSKQLFESIVNNL